MYSQFNILPITCTVTWKSIFFSGISLVTIAILWFALCTHDWSVLMYGTCTSCYWLHKLWSFLPGAMLDASPLMPCRMQLPPCRLTSDHPDLRDEIFQSTLWGAQSLKAHMKNLANRSSLTFSINSKREFLSSAGIFVGACNCILRCGQSAPKLYSCISHELWILMLFGSKPQPYKNLARRENFGVLS